MCHIDCLLWYAAKIIEQVEHLCVNDTHPMTCSLKSILSPYKNWQTVRVLCFLFVNHLLYALYFAKWKYAVAASRFKLNNQRAHRISTQRPPNLRIHRIKSSKQTFDRLTWADRFESDCFANNRQMAIIIIIIISQEIRTHARGCVTDAVLLFVYFAREKTDSSYSKQIFIHIYYTHTHTPDRLCISILTV